MVTRREFIQSSLVASAFAAHAGGAAFAGPVAKRAQQRSSPLAVFVLDTSLTGSPEFVIAARAAGAPLRVFDSDPGHLWMHEIAPRLRRRAEPIAGFTSAATLFCLHLLARDHGCDLVYRVRHAWAAPSTTAARGHPEKRRLPWLRHEFHGPESLNASADRFASGPARWPDSAVSMALRCPEQRAGARLEPVDPAADADARSLGFSWLIAPRQRG